MLRAPPAVARKNATRVDSSNLRDNPGDDGAFIGGFFPDQRWAGCPSRWR
jgi:hypothetical protein